MGSGYFDYAMKRCEDEDLSRKIVWLVYYNFAKVNRIFLNDNLSIKMDLIILSVDRKYLMKMTTTELSVPSYHWYYWAIRARQDEDDTNGKQYE